MSDTFLQQESRVRVTGVAFCFLVTIGILVAVLHAGLSFDVPQGTVGVSMSGMREVKIIEPGRYHFGKLTHGSVRIVKPGATEEAHFTMHFVPGTLDKVTKYGRRSILVNLTPIVGSAVRETPINRRSVPCDLKYTVPSKGELSALFQYAGTLDYEIAGIQRASWGALRPSEDAIGRRFFALSEEDMQKLIVEELAKYHVSVNEIHIGPVKHDTADLKDEIFEIVSSAGS